MGSTSLILPRMQSDWGIFDDVSDVLDTLWEASLSWPYRLSPCFSPWQDAPETADLDSGGSSRIDISLLRVTLRWHWRKALFSRRCHGAAQKKVRDRLRFGLREWNQMEFLEVAAAATPAPSQHVWGWFGIQSHSHHRIVPKTYQKQRRLDQGLIQHVAASTCQAERDLWYEPVDSVEDQSNLLMQPRCLEVASWAQATLRCRASKRESERASPQAIENHHV